MMDRMEEITVELKSRMLASFLFVSSELGMWCFGPDKELFYSTCPNESEFKILLELGEVLDFLYEREDGWEKPVMLSDELGLVWVAEQMFRNGKPDLLFIMGPAFISNTSAKSIDEALQKKETSILMKRQISRFLTSVPVIIHPTLSVYIKMLHFVITGEQLDMLDIYYKNAKTHRISEQLGGGELDLDEDKPPLTDPERVVKGEKILLQAISDGNLNYKQVFAEELQFGEGYISNTGDNMRDAKNTMLVFNALCSRAAIEGGLPAGIAKDMEFANTASIEGCQTITELTTVNIDLMDNYVRKVHECKTNPLISQDILQCCDYIRANVHKPLSAEFVASKFGYTTYYFTKKFHKEMGIRVTDYIKQARIEYAKVELLSSRKSIQEISDALQFGTRSYFSKVFSEIVGVTPAAYREQNGGRSHEV